MSRKALTTAVAAFVVTACTAAIALAGDPGQRLAVVKVPADAATWIDTGVDIEAGMAYPVSVAGTVFTAPATLFPPGQSPGMGRQAYSGAAGSIFTCVSGCYLNDVGFGALVGKIGTDGAPFYIGAGPGFSVPGVSDTGGRLYVAVNDLLTAQAIGDNTGSFTLTIDPPFAGVVVPRYGG